MVCIYPVNRTSTIAQIVETGKPKSTRHDVLRMTRWLGWSGLARLRLYAIHAECFWRGAWLWISRQRQYSMENTNADDRIGKQRHYFRSRLQGVWLEQNQYKKSFKLAAAQLSVPSIVENCFVYLIKRVFWIFNWISLYADPFIYDSDTPYSVGIWVIILHPPTVRNPLQNCANIQF